MKATTKGLMASVVVLLLAAAWQPAWAKEKKDTAAAARKVVAEAAATVKRFAADPEMKWFRDNVKKAKGVLVVPSVIRAGFIFGGSGGTGVLLARDARTGRWSYPAFFTIGSGSVGFQFGVEKAEVILLVMTEKGMDSLLATSFKLGVDATVAAGPVGAGVKAQLADIVSFSRSKGLYGGVSLEGAVVKVRDTYNAAYYGGTLTVRQIVYQKKAVNRHAKGLIAAVAAVGR